MITLVVGALLVNYSTEGPLSSTVIAGIFFTSGFIPLYGCILEVIQSKSFAGIKNPTNGLSLFLLILAFIMEPNPQDGWLATIGNPLFEAATLYMVFRMLFIKEGETAIKEKL